MEFEIGYGHEGSAGVIAGDGQTEFYLIDADGIAATVIMETPDTKKMALMLMASRRRNVEQMTEFHNYISGHNHGWRF